MCGEKILYRVVRLEGQGSPPRVRGKEFESAMSEVAARITPACAGKSKYPTFLTRDNRDHPRVCGEKILGEPIEGKG